MNININKTLKNTTHKIEKITSGYALNENITILENT